MFAVTITNTSFESATVTEVTDDIDSDGTDDVSYDPAVVCDTLTLAPSETATCTFTRFVSGEADEVFTDNAAGHVVDNDGTPAPDSDTADVTITDVLPDVSITKTADPTSVPETGGDVEFTIVVTNNSLEDATIDSLTDSDFDLAVRCPDAVGTVLGFEESYTYTCTFTEFSDNDGHSDLDSDDAHYFGIEDNQPSIQIEDIANQTTDGATVSGDVYITDQSEMGNDFVVAIETLDVHVEYLSGRGKNKEWVRIDATCTFDPTIPTTFNGDIWINFDCDLATAIPNGTKSARITVEAGIFNRTGKTFSYTEDLPLK